MFEHKGYTGSIDSADSGEGWFHGSVDGIQDVVTFTGRTVPELQKAFRDSVEDYLEFCAELKEPPEKPYSGKFVVRLSPELHKLASKAARQEDVSLNAWVIAAIEQRLHQSASEHPPLPFHEMENLAHCVAAILEERRKRPVPIKRKPQQQINAGKVAKKK